VSKAPLRPTRPSAAKVNAVAEAAKFAAPAVESRLSIRVSRETLRSIRKKAVLSDRKIKRFVLDALIAQGVDVAAQDLTDTDDTGDT
jgi:hypothetical protein